MPLVLAPSFDEHTREQIESHLSAVRARRLSAAIEYHQGKTAKLDHESSKLEVRIGKQYDLLKRELDNLEKLEIKIEDRLAGLTHLQNELGLVFTMRELHTDPTQEED